MRAGVLAGGVAALLSVLLPAAVAAQPAPAPLPAVTVVPVQRETITDQADFLGRIQAVDKVDLRARVEGFLVEKRFREGDLVKQGDILFVIDKAPFEAVVDQRKADLAAAEAVQKNAEVQLDRTRELASRGNAPQATLDQRIAEEAKATADILRARAALKQAEINLSWTDVVAPVAGRVGTANYTVGNLVGPGSQPLATLVSIDPMYVTFPITQRELLVARNRAGGSPDRIVVRLRLADGSMYPETGKLQLLDVQANQGTDSVTARAIIANPKGYLIDGASVRVVIDVGEPEKRLVIPMAAVAIDQQGPLVMVVGAGDRVEIKRPRLGVQRGAVVVVESGLAEGERVIVEGGQRVRPGMQVTPVPAPPAARS